MGWTDPKTQRGSETTARLPYNGRVGFQQYNNFEDPTGILTKSDRNQYFVVIQERVRGSGRGKLGRMGNERRTVGQKTTTSAEQNAKQ